MTNKAAKIGIVGPIVIVGIGLIYFAWMGKKSQNMTPAMVGVEGAEMKLQGCPDKPNCVSSQAVTESHHIAPIAFNKAKSFKEVIAVVESMGGTIHDRDESIKYGHFTFSSELFGFVDDFEVLVLDNLVEVRSASRVGHSDMGANKARVEKLRTML